MDNQFPHRVLVIEDDEDTRANLCDILELDDFHVQTAGTCSEGLEQGHTEDFLAIILDRRLPDGTAEELLPRIKRVRPDAAVIIVTGHADLDGAITALRHHVADYILKPINPEVLRTSLRRIAQMRRTAEALRRSENKYRCLFENANDLLFIIAPDTGKILDANIMAATELGYSRDQLLSLKISDVCENAGDHLRELLFQTSGSGSQVVERQFIRSNGRKFPVEISSTWLRDGAEPVIQSFARDITERKRSRDALIQERDFAESLIETAQAIVLVLDSQGRIVRFNRFLEDLSGYPFSEVAGQDWFSTFLPERDRPRIRDVFQVVLADGPVSGVINSIVTKDGKEREIAWWAKTLRSPSGELTGVLSVGHDVTELKRAQEKIVQNERLSAIGQMMAGLAHESRNALQRSQACLELLQRRVQENPKALELIARIQDAQDHLHQLYEEVRGYAAPIKLDRKPVRLCDVWRKAWDHLRPSRKGRDATLSEMVQCDSDCVIDQYRIEQVFRNLFENSLAACEDPVRLEVTLCEEKTDTGPQLVISVQDNGPGLTADQQERIFEPFFTTKTRGTGLGMAIVRRIVEAHGGTIRVGHSDQPGARIVVQLPRGDQ